MPSRPKARARFFAVGVIPFIVALAAWLIPIVVIASIDQRIRSWELEYPWLTEPEKKFFNDLQWRKSWWITEQTTVFNPVAAILLVTSIVALIAYGLVWRFA